MLLAVLMIGGAIHSGLPSHAADIVCGDGDKEAPETCDDGNLLSGDGCSSACTLEACSNNAIDLNEQCDDGNLENDDGCNSQCQMEFCGDSQAQEIRGEQCDDGNGISGDGCSSSCRYEGSKTVTPPDPIIIPPPPPPPPVGQPYAPPIIVTQAIQANAFLATQAGKEYKAHLTDSESIKLETIMSKLASGRRLNAEERTWVKELLTALEAAKLTERTRYTDLLKQFISTPISAEVVHEKNLKGSNLVDVEVLVAIEELNRAVDIINRGELKNAVLFDVSRLKRQGIDISSDVPPDFETYLTAGSRPLAVFTTLKALKEASEQYATTDLAASLERIHREAQALKRALPLFQQEYGLEPAVTEPLLTEIENVSAQATKQDLERVIASINRFMASLERKNIFTKADIASFETNEAHAAAVASRIAETVGLPQDTVTPETIGPLLDGLSETAPDIAKDSFERGTTKEQRADLLKFLSQNDRIQQLRSMLREDGQTDFDARYDALSSDIAHLGEALDSETLCDDSVPDALVCTNKYLADLENAVRGQSFFRRTIGTLQDFFGIGS